MGKDVKGGQKWLDAKDRKIIYELEKDARQPMSKIAKKARLSKETTNYRIKRLEKEGVIIGYFTTINSAALGYNLYRMFLRFQNTTPKKEEEIINYIGKIPMIARLCSVEGNWDLVASIRARNVFEFKQIYDEFISIYGEHIEQKHLTIATKIYHFLHNILYDSKDRSYFISEEAGSVKIDDTDMKIIKMLMKNCRIPTLDISKKTGISANAVKQRIKRLIKERVLLAFRIKINDNYFGYQHYHISLTLQNIDKEKKESLISDLIINPNVYFIVEAIGEADLEFEIHVRNSSELYGLLKDLRNKFDCIRDHQTFLFYEPHIFR